MYISHAEICNCNKTVEKFEYQLLVTSNIKDEDLTYVSVSISSCNIENT